MRVGGGWGEDPSIVTHKLHRKWRRTRVWVGFVGAVTSDLTLARTGPTGGEDRANEKVAFPSTRAIKAEQRNVPGGEFTGHCSDIGVVLADTRSDPIVLVLSAAMLVIDRLTRPAVWRFPPRLFRSTL